MDAVRYAEIAQLVKFANIGEIPISQRNRKVGRRHDGIIIARRTAGTRNQDGVRSVAHASSVRVRASSRCPFSFLLIQFTSRTMHGCTAFCRMVFTALEAQRIAAVRQDGRCSLC